MYQKTYYLNACINYTRNVEETTVYYMSMCGCFTSRKPEKIKINGINAADLEGAKPHYNVAPSQQILDIIQTSDEKHALYLHWGLIPSWSKEQSAPYL